MMNKKKLMKRDLIKYSNQAVMQARVKFASELTTTTNKSEEFVREVIKMRQKMNDNPLMRPTPSD